jgi:hypothetical protein
VEEILDDLPSGAGLGWPEGQAWSFTGLSHGVRFALQSVERMNDGS